MTVEEPNTRDKIITFARAEFAEMGLEGARVDRIAERAGVNKAMLYYHFKSKEDLYREIIKKFYQEKLPRLAARIDQQTTLEGLLRSVMQTHLEMFHEEPNLIPILLRELATPSSSVLLEYASFIKESGIPERVMKFLHARIESGEMRELDVKAMWASFLTSSIGYYLIAPLICGVMGIEDREAFDRKRIDTMVDVMLNGVRRV